MMYYNQYTVYIKFQSLEGKIFVVNKSAIDCVGNNKVWLNKDYCIDIDTDTEKELQNLMLGEVKE